MTLGYGEGVLDALEVGVVVHAPDTSILYANEAAARLLGRSRAELLSRSSRSDWDLRRPDGSVVTVEEQPVMIAIRTGAPVQNVVLGVSVPDEPERRWIRVTATPCRRGRALEQVVVTLTDVSDEHERASAEMRARVASEEQHASVLRAMSEGVVVHDGTGAIVFCNPSAERILGLTLDQMRGALDRWTLVDAAGAPLPRDAIPSEITRETGRPCRDVLLGLDRGDGSRAWLSVSTDKIAGGDHVVATFTDVTAQREAQLAAERANERISAVTSALPGALYQALLRPDGVVRIVFAAGETLELTGMTSEQLTDPRFDIMSIVDADDASAITNKLGPEPWRTPVHEIEFRLRSGAGVRWARARATATQTPDGVLFTGVVLDISEGKRLAAQLARAELREALGDLAAGMAHNFNNMLGAVIPSLTELRQHVLPEGKEMLEDAHTASRRAADLVRQLMQLARGDSSPPEPVDARAVVSDVASLCKRTFDRRIEILVDIAPKGPMVTRGRASQLHQALLNLCLNARDALAHERVPRLWLTLDKDGHSLVIVVRDNGAGMTEETLRQLGEPFFTTKPPGRGTGLGMASAMRVVREMNGELIVESKRGEGTSVRIRVPATDESLAAESDSSPKNARGFRVLLVEDEPLVRRVMSRVLVRYTHEVESAEGGEQALSMLEARRFDVVLLDLSMPGMSGRAALEEMKRRWPELPVIVISGNVSDTDGLERAAAILEKPISAEELAKAIARAVEQR